MLAGNHPSDEKNQLLPFFPTFVPPALGKGTVWEQKPPAWAPWLFLSSTPLTSTLSYTGFSLRPAPCLRFLHTIGMLSIQPAGLTSDSVCTQGSPARRAFLWKRVLLGRSSGYSNRRPSEPATVLALSFIDHSNAADLKLCRKSSLKRESKIFINS